MNKFNFTREISNISDFETKLTDLNCASPFVHRAYIELVQNGAAFLAFRNEEATIYYNGNKLCNLAAAHAYEPSIYNLYLPFIRSKALVAKAAQKSSFKKEPYFKDQWTDAVGIKTLSFNDVYYEILDNIEKESSPESVQASRFYQFSPMNIGYSHNIILLDIEAAFVTKEGNKLIEKRIDLVFYNIEERRLLFIEVKRLEDKRWGTKRELGTTEVLKQLNDYRDIIKEEKDNIKIQYNKVISYYNQLANSQIPPIGDEPPLLGLLIVEHTSDKKETQRIKDIKSVFEGEGFGVYSIGDTDNINKKEPLKADATLASIYNRMKKKYKEK